MAAQLQWHGAGFEEWYKALVAARLERAVRHVANRVKEKLSLSGVGFSGRPGKRGTRIYGFIRSKPGEPPRKQTGTLRRGITYEVDKDLLIARVGVMGPALPYAKALELGTPKMKRRPFLRQTLFEESANIQQILDGKGMQGLSAGPGPGVNVP